MLYSVVIPCYRSDKTIRKVVEDYRRCLPEAVVYVYDRNQGDKILQTAVKKIK